MARRKQRRPVFRPNRSGQRPERTIDQRVLEARARELLEQHDERALESLVGDVRLVRDEADRIALEEPSPEHLNAYRRAARNLQHAERALGLMAQSD